MLKDIYNKNICIMPYRETKDNGLSYLLPLEEYDKILVGFSGGKDSVSAVLYLLELGVPKDKIILLHHCIDGAKDNPVLNMDWRCTKDYCQKFANYMNLIIKYSWREEGFIGEIFRFGASKPISFEELTSSKVTTISTKANEQTKILLDRLEEENNIDKLNEIIEEIKELGYRYKFPAKTASLNTRWCSSVLKIEVCNRLIRYSEDTYENCKLLFIDGIRREESGARSKYNEMEEHTTSALTQKNRLVHHWRPIIEWDEKMVWDIIKKYNINPHPCYKLGWNRCSCSMCIFGLPKHFKGIKEILPDSFNQVVKLEEELGFTLDNKKSIEKYIENADSCILNRDEELIKYIQTGILPDDYIYLENWETPVGAFHGAEGGPC